MNDFETVLENVCLIINEENERNAQEIKERMREGTNLLTAIELYPDKEKQHILVFKDREIDIPAAIQGRLMSRLRNMDNHGVTIQLDFDDQ